MFLRDRRIGDQIRQHQVKNRPLGIHDAAGQAADRAAVVRVGQQEHGTRQHRCAVGDDVRARVFDRKRRLVVRVHAHAAGADHHFAAFLQHSLNRGRDLLVVVVQHHMLLHLAAELRHLRLDDRREGILDASVEDLVSGGDQAVLLRLHREELHDGLSARRLLRRFHALLLDHQGDHPGAAELVALFHHEAGRPRRNHHVPQGVHRPQALEVNEEQAVRIGDQFDLAFLRFRGRHVRVHADIPQDIGRVVFVEHALVIFPDIDRVLAHAQQHRHILRPNHMALAEHRVLRHTADDLGDIMAQDLSDRVLSLHQLHWGNPPVLFWEANCNKKQIAFLRLTL